MVRCNNSLTREFKTHLAVAGHGTPPLFLSKNPPQSSVDLMTHPRTIGFYKNILHGFNPALETKRSELSLFLYGWSCMFERSEFSENTYKNKLMNSFDELRCPLVLPTRAEQMVAKEVSVVRELNNLANTVAVESSPSLAQILFPDFQHQSLLNLPPQLLY